MELKAFLWVFYTMDYTNWILWEFGNIFFDSYGLPIFSAVMSRNRFAFVLHNLSFDDKSTSAKRWKKDRSTAIGEFFEIFYNQCVLV